MINVFISAFIMIVSFNFFYVTYQMCGVNRVVISTPIQLFEKNILLISNAEEPNLYFQKQDLIDSANEYYKAIEKYTPDYEVNIRFYNAGGYSICTSPQCKAVVIYVDAYLTFNLTMHKELFYEIKRN